ncbi:MAG: hypothetical protein R3C14_44745 [Caldilineaceae bacterium]
MSATTIIKLTLPARLQPVEVQRTILRHLLLEGQTTMPDALSLLAVEDQAWLVEKLIRDAEDALLLAAYLTDATLRERHWQQYNDLLGYLFHWHEHWSTHHSALLNILRITIRCYPVQDLTPKRAKVMQRLTARLHDDFMCREDVLAAEKALQHVGWDVVLNLAYLEELVRT